MCFSPSLLAHISDTNFSPHFPIFIKIDGDNDEECSLTSSDTASVAEVLLLLIDDDDDDEDASSIMISSNSYGVIDVEWHDCGIFDDAAAAADDDDDAFSSPSNPISSCFRFRERSFII